MATVVYKPEGKDIMTPLNILSWFIAPMENKTWFYERLIFEDKKNTA